MADLTVPLEPVGGKVKLRILADRRSLEVFANDGAVAVARRIAPQPGAPTLEHAFRAHTRQSRDFSWEEYPLRSAW